MKLIDVKESYSALQYTCRHYDISDIYEPSRNGMAGDFIHVAVIQWAGLQMYIYVYMYIYIYIYMLQAVRDKIYFQACDMK